MPEDTIGRRFSRILYNFNSLCMPLADQWAVLDNTAASKATQVATQEGDNLHIK